ncbi:MAG: SDR family oxidoreductase [Archangiaceae bacterium]|nr:SDR family oxidoreductase [Archangiaceae bacterium]
MKSAGTILVTGAGRGIGRAIALGLAEKTQAKLVLVSRTASCRKVAAEIEAKHPGRAVAFEWDVTDRGPGRDQVLEAVARGPRPLGLVHCAAVLGPTGPFVENDLGAWWSAMQTNLFGTANVVHGLLPEMQRDQAGRMVLFAGGGAAYGYPNFSSYGTAKAALVRFAETVAMELGDASAVLTILAPGANETDMLAEVRRAGGEVKTTVDISEPVNAVVRLMTEDTRGLHGRFLHVRDGWSPETARELGADMFKLRRVEKR